MSWVLYEAYVLWFNSFNHPDLFNIYHGAPLYIFPKLYKILFLNGAPYRTPFDSIEGHRWKWHKWGESIRLGDKFVGVRDQRGKEVRRSPRLKVDNTMDDINCCNFFKIFCMLVFSYLISNYWECTNVALPYTHTQIPSFLITLSWTDKRLWVMVIKRKSLER